MSEHNYCGHPGCTRYVSPTDLATGGWMMWVGEYTGTRLFRCPEHAEDWK